MLGYLLQVRFYHEFHLFRLFFHLLLHLSFKQTNKGKNPESKFSSQVYLSFTSSRRKVISLVVSGNEEVTTMNSLPRHDRAC